jgi:hypothetical protein
MVMLLVLGGGEGGGRGGLALLDGAAGAVGEHLGQAGLEGVARERGDAGGGDLALRRDVGRHEDREGDSHQRRVERRVEDRSLWRRHERLRQHRHDPVHLRQRLL